MIRSSIAVYREAYLGLSRPTWWLAMVMFVNRAGTMVLPFMTVYLKEKLNFSITDAGWEIALFGTGAIIGNFVGGRLTDAAGFSRVQFWSLLLNGILFFVLGQLQTFWLIGGCLFVIGVVGESFRPANAAAIAFYSLPENRTRSYSLNRLAINLGFSFGPAIGGLLAYRDLFWVDGATCVIAALCLRAALPPVEVGTKQRGHKSDPASSVWKDTVYLKFCGFIFLVGLCFLQMFSMIPLFYKDHWGLSKPVIGLVLGLNGFVIVVTEMVLVFKLEGRRSPVQYISLGAFLMGLSYLVLNLPWPGLSLAVVGMFIITFGEMLMFPFINNFWISRSTESNRGQYASIYSMSFAGAQILAPSLGSQVAQHFNYSVLWYVIFGLSLIASIGFYQFKKYYR